MLVKIQQWIQSIPVKTRFALRLTILVIALLIMVIVLHAINLQMTATEDLGNDFVTHWLSIKLFLARGQNPYSPEVRQTVDRYAMDVLGWRTAIPGETAFLMPIYGFLVYLPFLFFDSYVLAYSWWITFLEICIFFIGYLSFRLVKKNIRKDALIFVLVIIAACFNPFTLNIIREGQLFPLTLLFLLLAVAALKNESDELAGVLLAFSSLQYFQFWLPIVFIIIWSFRQGRGKLPGWFFGTILLLGISSALLMPEWLLYFSRGLFQYFTDIPPQFLPDIMSTYYPGTFQRLGILVMAVFGLVVGVEWYLSNRRQFAPFYWTFAITLVLNLIFIPRFSSSLLLSVIPALALIAILWKDRWGTKGIVISIGLTAAFMTFSWVVGSSVSLNDGQKIFWEIVGSVGFFVVLLYWIRWWLFKNTDLWFEEVYSFENPDRRNFWDAE